MTDTTAGVGPKRRPGLDLPETPAVGRTELGRVSIADTVVRRIAARAATEHPDAGSAATRVLGRTLPGAGHLGTRSTELGGLPRTSVVVDGSKAYITLEISVRWPKPVPRVAAEVRRHVCDRVEQLTGLTVDEVHITVADLATDIAAPPRVR
jgi:uncharacterized alkaline shock family protein YloU